MKIFVPKFRHHMPHMDPEILTSMFVEINRKALDGVLDHWEKMDSVSSPMAPAEFFSAHVKDVCARKPKKNTLEPFLRRPHVTLHGGSKEGSGVGRDIFIEGAYKSGYIAAQNGFNMWYGGGDTGLMGQFANGFNDAIKIHGRLPDQYLIQIIPSQFVRGVKSIGGLKPANEGLCDITDAAIIMPDFDTRLHLLNSRCAAAVTNPGGSGSLEELAGIMRLIKTGLKETLLYISNPHIPDKYYDGYYDLLKLHVERTVERGLENPGLLARVHYKATVEEIYQDLMLKLAATNATPNEVYAAYCTQNRARPGIPKRKSPRPVVPPAP
ncbi:MAG: LOG family protein [Alphaproteobacteria bacterium]